MTLFFNAYKFTVKSMLSINYSLSRPLPIELEKVMFQEDLNAKNNKGTLFSL